VVKELIENSLDSGADKITVSVEDGGRKSITVIDNGEGISAEDLQTAFQPHATSKISTTKDLSQISSLGFRGEALASIASIAKVRAVSRRKDSTQAAKIEIDCGKKTEVAPCSGDYGTTVKVSDIFYKIPARRKFLRTANTEMGHITEQFIRIALANEGVDMTLEHNKRQRFRIHSDYSTSQRISTLFNKEIADNLLVTQRNRTNQSSLSKPSEKLEIYALLGKPEISRTSGKYQYTFLNGRFIRDKFISHAVREAYRGIIEPGRYPVLFLFITIPYSEYDVNVHPTKTEVRFYNSNLIHSEVLSCLREKLLGTELNPAADFSENISSNKNADNVKEAIQDFFDKYKTSSSQSKFRFSSLKPSAKNAAYGHSFNIQKSGYQPGAEQDYSQPQRQDFIQIHNSYIVFQHENGFEIIDQHALHERTIYEKLRNRISKGRLESQKLLVPETVTVSEVQTSLIERHGDLLKKLGIEIVSFGPDTCAVQSFPTLLASASVGEFVTDLLDILDEKTNDDNLLDDVLNMAACKAAVKAGEKLTNQEIEQLLEDRENLELSARCPHGRPTTINFTLKELEKQFKRT
jgi:DNA mismatch repair protein MutL